MTSTENKTTFQTLKEFNKQYDLLRKDVLKRHGFKEGDKVRLKNVIILYQNFNDSWVKVASSKVDMRDRIKMYQGEGAEFKLEAKENIKWK